MRDAAALLPIAESIADGSAVDWNVVEAGTAEADQPTLRQLRVLADLATLHRTMPADPKAGAGRNAARRTAAAPAIGTWGRLELIARIGSGRFGEVYRAWDCDLEREVALKLLQSDALTDQPPSPIVTDGRLPARVHHPNVVTVYGVDVHDGRVGVWMELVDGETLEQFLATHGPFSAREATLVGIDLCRALAAIHRAGLIHRDIKPQNVMREQGGRIVLMDFGTGRDLVATAAGGFADLAGTPLYLAPELLAGDAAGPWTDLYSLGVLLFHLVTRSFPVHARTLVELTAAHHRGQRTRLRDLRPDLPTAFVRVVDRAIAVDPKERYDSAGALEADLVRALDDAPKPDVQPAGSGAPRPPGTRAWWLGAALAAALALALLVAPGLVQRWTSNLEPRTIRSLAVLPLTNMSGDPNQEYFADGMTEALIDRLAKVRALRVISRTSAMRYKNSNKSLAEIAAALNVDGVLEGSVMRSGDRVRISADLVHIASDRHVWAETYDRDVKDVLALQSEVAQMIARQVQVQLTPVELAGFAAIPRVSPSAEEAYLQGRYYWNKRTDEGYQKALDYFRQSAALDPSFARAYAGQADVYNLLPGQLAPTTAYPLAKEAANRALELEPTLGEAHTSLAFATFIFDRDWTTAEAAFRRALQFNPGYATAHHWYGEFLGAMGRPGDARAEFETARALDPLSTSIRVSIADAYYIDRRYDDAIAAFRAVLAEDGDPSAYNGLALAYGKKGLFDDARATLNEWSTRVGPSASQRAIAATIAAMSGDRPTALKLSRELSSHGSELDAVAVYLAYAYIYLDRRDEAFALLSQAERTRAPTLLWSRVDPIFDPIRGDPRFVELLQRLRLEP